MSIQKVKKVMEENVIWNYKTIPDYLLVSFNNTKLCPVIGRNCALVFIGPDNNEIKVSSSKRKSFMMPQLGITLGELAAAIRLYMKERKNNERIFLADANKVVQIINRYKEVVRTVP